MRRFYLLLVFFTSGVLGAYKMVPKPSLGSWTIPVLHQPFELSCIVFGLPQNHDIHLTYTWLKDSREIPGQTGESLLFPNLTRENGGVYTCRARSGHVLTTSPDSNEKEVMILLPPRVHMEPASPDNVIRRAAGEGLTLTCKVTEAFPWVPADGYRWSYLPSRKGLRQPLVGRESTLRLGPLTREDGGQYFCQARNDLYVFQGLISPGDASVTVDVTYESSVVALKPNASISKQIREGQNLTLTCVVEVTSLPLPPFSWTFQPSASTPPPPPSPQQLQETGVTLTLGPLTREDSGLYSCQVGNADGQSSLNLTVVDKSSTTVMPNESTSKQNTEDKSSTTMKSNESISKPNTEETSFRTATIVLGVMLGGAVIVILAVLIYAWKKKELCFASSGAESVQSVKWTRAAAPPPDNANSEDQASQRMLQENNDAD